MADRVAGKVALVTGAARGQGRSHAVRLAEEGADLIVLDACRQFDTVPFPLSTPADLAETVDLVKATGRRVFTAEVDICDLEGLTAAVAAGVAELGRLDIICGNAGIGSYGRAWEMSPETWSEMISVNLTGAWNTIRATVPLLLTQGQGGSIILTSSSAAMHSIPNGAHYSAAKRGVVGLAQGLAQELGPHLIRVNTVHPTGVSTPMILNDFTYRLFLPEADSPGKDDIAKILLGTNAIPVPWVDPIDVSNAVLFLASDEARYVTGCQLTVDAGATIKFAGVEL